MSKDNQKHAQWVTRYNLTIAFEELYTQDDAQLHASANAIGEIARTIEQLIITDTALQTLLRMQNLKLRIVSPDRGSKQDVDGNSRGSRPPLSPELA